MTLQKLYSEKNLYETLLLMGFRTQSNIRRLQEINRLIQELEAELVIDYAGCENSV